MSTLPPESPIRFETNDAFGWIGFAGRLEAFLFTERGFVDGSLVVSLNAPFGSGKSTFVRMWKNHLDERIAAESKTPMCVLLNAWEDDYCGDPLLSLVDAINGELERRSPNSETRQGVAAIKEATKDVGWFMVGMANSAVSHLSGFDPGAAGEFANAQRTKRSKEPVPDILSMFQARKAALQRLKSELGALFSRTEFPVLVFVDELDRCRPDFAVQYLETIKHVFDVEGLVFILAVDLAQLENSARALFGQALNFPEYYRKFAHRNIQLPKPDEHGFRNLVTRYTEKYLHDPGEDSPRRKSWLNVKNAQRSLIELSSSLRLTPRQIQEAFRILGHLTAGKHGDKQELYFQVGAASMFLAFVSIGRPTTIYEIAAGKMRLNELLKLVVELLPGLDWWAFVLTMSHSCEGEELEMRTIHAEFVEHGLIGKETTTEEFQSQLSQFRREPFGTSMKLSTIAQKLLAVERFAT
jgi:hypothetical protein